MVWTNTPRIVYHGTDQASANGIINTDISVSHCNARTDFGLGFYVTTSLPEARFWADWRAHTTKGIAVVMAFDLDREGIAALGDHIAFTRPDDDFHDFVHYNRSGQPHHGRVIQRGPMT